MKKNFNKVCRIFGRLTLRIVRSPVLCSCVILGLVAAREPEITYINCRVVARITYAICRPVWEEIFPSPKKPQSQEERRQEEWEQEELMRAKKALEAQLRLNEQPEIKATL